MSDLNRIKALIDQHEVISFDIYNTLLVRHVLNDCDVFSIIQDYYNRTAGQNRKDFPMIRLEAEKKAKETMGKDSVTFDEIYQQMSASDEAAVVFKEIEWKLEQAITAVRKEGCKLYEYCLKQGKKVIAISDMYYEGSHLKELLAMHGYKIDKVFSSSDYGVTKHSGELFQKVCKTIHIAPHKILHIGDSYRSDFLMAKKSGLNAAILKFIETCHAVETHNSHENIYVNAMYKYAANLCQDSSFYTKLGVEKFGPLLFGFCCWLNRRLDELNIQRVYFLSRDAYIIKEAFENIFPDTKKELRYFYVSRKSVRVPLLCKYNKFSDLSKHINNSKYMTFRIFVNRLGLKIEDIQCDLNIDIDKEYTWNAFFENKQIEENYARIKEKVIKNAHIEMEHIRKYFIQEQLQGTAALVDIGWDGTIQKALNEMIEMLSLDCRLYGFYMGVNNQIESDSFGYIYDYHDDRHCTEREALVASYGLFESLFLANHGSVRKYECKDNRIVPVLEPYEFITSDGRELQELHIIKEIQKAALDFIKGYCNCKYICCGFYNHVYYFEPLKSTLINPTGNEVEKLKKIPFHDTINVSLVEDVQNLKDFLHAFKNSVWKIGFLKNSIKMKLPYFSIYKLAKKMY